MAGEGSAIGTTRRGIGPAYGGKVRRSGIRFCDIVDQDITRGARMVGLLRDPVGHLRHAGDEQTDHSDLERAGIPDTPLHELIR